MRSLQCFLGQNPLAALVTLGGFAFCTPICDGKSMQQGGLRVAFFLWEFDMAKLQVIDYDTTAANNTDINSIGIQGTSPVSNFDNAFREKMAQDAAAVTRHVTKVAGTYTALKTDHNQLWRATGAATFNLTAAATLTTGWALWVKADGGAVTVDPSSAELINGAATLTVADGNGALVICTGTAFFAIAFGKVAGAASSTDNAVARFDGTNGGALQNSGVTIDDSSNMTIGGVLNVTGSIINTGIVSHPTGGTMVIRPNGSGSATGQLVLSTTGALTVAADVTAAQDFKSSTNTAILNTTGAGSVYLRPNGVGSATGQLQLLSTGAVTINGTLTVTG